MQPKLVVKPAFARPLVKGKRMRVQVYVLDLVGGDSEEEMLARLDRYHGSIQIAPGSVMPVAELPPGAPEGAVPFEAVEDIVDAEIVDDDPGPADTGPDSVGTAETPPSEPTIASEETAPAVVAAGTGPVEHDALPLSASGSASEAPGRQDETPLPAAGAGTDDGEPVLAAVAPAPGVEPSTDEKALADQAAKMKPPWGSYQTQTLGTIYSNPSGNGRAWIEYAIKQSVDGKESNATFERALWAFVKVYLPDLYAEHKEHAK
jgi:hypothetical protein